MNDFPDVGGRFPVLPFQDIFSVGMKCLLKESP